MPEWTLSGGLAGGGLIYTHQNGARAHVHVNDDGDLDVATWDPSSGDERVFPDREALEMIVDADIRRLRESGRNEDRAMLLVSGVGDFAAVRSYRGRNKRWDRPTLARFVDDVLERGMPEAARKWGIKPRQGLAVMRIAADMGLARIEKSGGERSRNIYSRGHAISDDQRTPADARGDWHRRSWLELERIRRELQSNWERRRTRRD